MILVLLQKKEWKLRFFNTLFCCILIVFLSSGFVSSERRVINATKNVVLHNNRGVNYLKEGHYMAAIASFKIALGLNPDSTLSAVVYDNLGTVYLKIGEYKLAQECFEAAILFSPSNFSYYRNLVEAYKLQNILEEGITNCKIEPPMSEIIMGLTYIELGQALQGEEILNRLIVPQIKKIGIIYMKYLFFF